MIGRYEAIAKILEHVPASDLVLSTTGMISREVFMTKDRPENFYMIGSMGLLSSFGWVWHCCRPSSGCSCSKATGAPS